MTFLQIGMAKSGNFWLYRILRDIISLSGIEYRSFIEQHPIYELAKTWELSHDMQAGIDVLDIEPQRCFYRIASIFRMPIDDLDDYVRQCSHVWTHSTFCPQSLDVLTKFDKIVYIVRDPRDVAISLSRFAFTPYMQKHRPTQESDPGSYLAARLDRIMRHWVRHVAGYLEHRDESRIHFVFYERLLHSFDAELSRLLQYLDIELEQDALSQIKRNASFQVMKDQNPLHVRKGKAGQWDQVLTRAQKRLAVQIAGPMLDLLHYPRRYGEVDGLPGLPTQLDGGYLRQAREKARRRLFVERLKKMLQPHVR